MVRAISLACIFVVACGDHPSDGLSLVQKRAEMLQLQHGGDMLGDSEQLAHWVVVTDCSAYQFNQGNLMLASAHHVNQPGQFTWIVYGCDRDEQFAAFKKIAHPTARVWHQPEGDIIDPATGKPYPAFQASNRPVAVQAWYEATQPKEQAIAIIDPDMTWLRPVRLVQNLQSNASETADTGSVSDAWATVAASPKQGTGARYGQGCIPNHFSDEQMKNICGEKDADICIATKQDYDACSQSYSSGPPWIVHESDAKNVLAAWTDTAVKVHEVYPELLAEQVSYGVTQMKFGVKNSLDSFWFLSAPGDSSQPWDSIADVDFDPCRTQDIPPAVKGMPPLWHACSTFSLHGDGNSIYRLHKDHIHKDLLDCDAPLLRQPPLDSLERYRNSDGKSFENTMAFRETWSLCTYTNTVNFYAGMWKKQYCKAPNLEPAFEYPGYSMGFWGNDTWLETVFRRGGWQDVDYKVGKS